MDLDRLGDALAWVGLALVKAMMIPIKAIAWLLTAIGPRGYEASRKALADLVREDMAERCQTCAKRPACAKCAVESARRLLRLE